MTDNKTVIIFAESLSKQNIAFIRETSAQAGKVICYTVKLPKQKILVASNVTVKALPVDSGKQVQTFSFYHVARKMVDCSIEHTKQLIPDFFSDTSTGYNYENIYRFSLQFDIAANRLPEINRFTETLLGESFDQVILLNLQYLDEANWPLLKKHYPILIQYPAHFITTSQFTYLPIFQKFELLFKQLSVLSKRLFRPYHPQITKNGILSFCRISHHAAILKPSLKTLLTNQQAIHFLDLIPDYRHQENPAFYPALEKELKEAGNFETLNFRGFQPDFTVLKQNQSFINERLAKIALLAISPEQKETLKTQLSFVTKLLKHIARLDNIIATLKPKAVLACMDVDAFSLMLMELQKKYAFKTVNYLHGPAPSLAHGDLLHYDAFMVWSERTKQNLIEDGYADTQTLRVVGNPTWKEERDISLLPADNPTLVNEITQWKAQDKLITAYSQSPGNCTSITMRTRFFEVLAKYLETHPNVKLLVKKHPNEFDNLPEEVLASFNIQGRYRVFKAKEFSLLDSFKVATVLTSICSTVLLEGLYYQLPAFAIDFASVNKVLGNGIDTTIPCVTSENDLTDTINDVLHQGLNHPAFNQASYQMLYPEFENTYIERITAELEALRLIEASPALNQPKAQLMGTC